MDENNIKQNLEKIYEKINKESVLLITVTKTRTIDEIKKAINLGVKFFAENKIQEALAKYDKLKDFLKENNVEFHFIGHLQTNKAKKAVEIFDLIQSIDSLKLAKEINKRAKDIDKIQRILIQVNIGEESQKSGCLPEDTIELIKETAKMNNVKIEGLMCIAPYFSDTEKTRPYFKKMKELFDTIKQSNIENIEMKYLSMGMTQDYKIAIEEGANMIRIGTALFQ